MDLDKLFEEAIHDVLYDPVSQTHMIPKKQPRYEGERGSVAGYRICMCLY